MCFEDEKLIPKLHELDNPGRWPASLYTGEHAKIRELMENTKSDLSSLRTGRLLNQNLRREVIVFLDREKMLKGVREHHQEREEAGMLMELDKETDAEWRVSTIEPYLKEWNCRMKRVTEVVRSMGFLTTKMEQLVAGCNGSGVRRPKTVE
jgi:hypothetical protein